MTAVEILSQSDELAVQLVAAHEGDALAAHNDAQHLAEQARGRGDLTTARIHTLAAAAIAAQHPEHFVI